MRRYITACRKKNPTIPPNLAERLVGAYVELRNEARNEKNTFTSPRSLLAILRFSTALVSKCESYPNVTEKIILVSLSVLFCS